MNQQAYEYRGLMATLWDFFRGDTSKWEDKFFFRDLIQQYGQPVLDVGCGTGRLVLDYLAEGLDVDGVDNSPEMLALCREKGEKLGLKPNVYVQWMESLVLPRKYRTMIVPSSSFQLVLDKETAVSAMHRFYEHLLPGGVLAMPFMVLWAEGDPVEGEWSLIAEKTRPEDGAVARRYGRCWYDVANQLEHTEDRYEVILNGEIVAQEHHRRSPATRWYSQEQVRQLYAEVGFTNTQLFKGFTQEPATNEDTIFTVVGVKG